MSETENTIKPSVVTIKKFFGTLPGQTIVEFKNEYGQLTEADKLQLTIGINDGSLTY